MAQGLDKRLKELADEFKSRVIRQAKIEKLKASGKFIDSIKSEVNDGVLSIYSDVEYSSAIEYGAPVEGGEKKGFARTDTLIQWMKRKNIRPLERFTTESGDKGVKFSKLSDKAYKRAAFAIQKTIKDKGTIKRYNYKGANLFERIYEEMKTKIGDGILEGYVVDFEEELDKELRILLQVK